MNAKILRRLELLDTKGRKIRIKGQRKGPDANINITPLVDVVLVLLIIFMVVTPMLNEGLELPKSMDPTRLNAMTDDLKININQQGEIRVGDKPSSDSKLKEDLAKELEKNPFRPVYLSADKALQFGTIRTVLSALRDAGVSQAGLVTSFTSEEP